MAKTLIIAGLVIAACGVFMLVGGKLGFGKLPGDINAEGDGWSVSFPIVTCIIISIVVTVILNFFRFEN